MEQSTFVDWELATFLARGKEFLERGWNYDKGIYWNRDHTQTWKWEILFNSICPWIMINKGFTTRSLNLWQYFFFQIIIDFVFLQILSLIPSPYNLPSLKKFNDNYHISIKYDKIKRFNLLVKQFITDG